MTRLIAVVFAVAVLSACKPYCEDTTARAAACGKTGVKEVRWNRCECNPPATPGEGAK